MAFSQVNETEEIHSLKIINGDFCNTGGSVFFKIYFCNNMKAGRASQCMIVLGKKVCLS